MPAPQNENNKMKLTKRQLRRIIKEEKVKLLNEQSVPQDLLEELNSVMGRIYNAVASGPTELDPEEDTANLILSEVEGFLDSIGMRGTHLKY